MVFDWLLLGGALAVAALVAGTAAGLMARGREWTRHRTSRFGYHGLFALLIVGGLVQQRMGLPYAPNLLAKAGHPAVAMFASLGMIIGAASLARWVAQRVGTG